MTTGLDMRERLLRAQEDNERDMAYLHATRRTAPVEPQGLRDMRCLAYQQHREERSAFGFAGVMTLVVLAGLGALIGFAVAEWWTGGSGLASTLACLRGPQ